MGRIARLTARKARPAAAVAGLAILAACGGPHADQAPPEPGDQAVAHVDGQTIWASDVKREAVAEGVISPGDPLDVASDTFHQVLDEVIDTKVLADEALRQHLDKDPLAQRRLAVARDRALEGVILDNVVAKAVTPATENALYQDFLKNRTPGENIHLRQIVTASEPDAEAVKHDLAGGAAFEAEAMTHSTDPETRLKGGDLGVMTTDTLPQPIADAVKGVKAGQVVGPVKVDAGWAVVRIDDRQPEPAPSLDQVRPQLIEFIRDDQVKSLILRLRKQAKIDLLIAPPPDVPGAPAEPASAPPRGTLPAANAAANAAVNNATAPSGTE